MLTTESFHSQLGLRPLHRTGDYDCDSSTTPVTVSRLTSLDSTLIGYLMALVWFIPYTESRVKTLHMYSAYRLKQLLFHPSFTLSPLHCYHRGISSSLLALASYSTTLSASTRNKKKLNRKDNSVIGTSRRVLIDSVVKWRTRSDKKFDEESFRQFGDTKSHIPVMLGEVLEVFDSHKL
ncbi:unnamed protein product [Lactuca virosa]|uniref:Uncharacterized protein n=1 Tax=Lactuca virosa TaxID=75947 RepID=A0AAU9MBX4_9ASTR|nr:unnamed protein product [Lactuca virosa]